MEIRPTAYMAQLVLLGQVRVQQQQMNLAGNKLQIRKASIRYESIKIVVVMSYNNILYLVLRPCLLKALLDLELVRVILD